MADRDGVATVSFLKRLVHYATSGVLGVAVSVFTLLSIQACSAPPLKPWHTEELTEEFTAEKTSEVRSFDDYRQLEDRLFAQLETEVYAQTGTGPEYALVRYSSGSAADPQQRKPNWNRSFELRTDAPVGGVLMLHGMSDSPYSLRALGKNLNQHNYWVIGLRLPGHGTAPSGLTRISWEEMAAAVRLSMTHLASKVGENPVHIIGYSNGAPLALDFALNAQQGSVAPAPASLVLISPAVGLHPAAALAKWKRRLSLLPGLGGLGWLQIQPEFDPYRYNSFATNAAEQVHRLTRSVARRIKTPTSSKPTRLLPPTLVFKSTVDATVSTDAVVDNLLAHLAPNRHELVLFDINRTSAKSTILVADPGPLTARLMSDETLPFAVTLITNENPQSRTVVSRRKAPFSTEPADSEPLGLAWPRGVISLSHVALPFPPDDPMYGAHPPQDQDQLFLGRMAVQGERGLLKLPPDWLLRLRHNPFYDYLERRALEWMEDARGKDAKVASTADS